MATFKLVLDKRHKFDKDKYHLVMRLSHKKHVIMLRINKLLTEKDFQVIFKKQSFDEKILEVRKKYESFIERAYRIFESVKPFDIKKIREHFYNKHLILDKLILDKDREKGTLKYLFNQYNEYNLSLDKISISTSDLMRDTFNSLRSFAGDITYQDVTPDFLAKYQVWFLGKFGEKKRSIPTFSSRCRNLRTVLNFAIKKKLVAATYESPFKEFDIPNEIPPKKVLSLEEIQKIIDYKDFENRWEEYARDIWVLLYRMNGINFIDLLKLKWSDAMNNRFIIYRHKTYRTKKKNKRPIKINVTEKIRSVLEKIGDKESLFVLGKLNEENYSESYLLNKNRKYKKKINFYLKKIGEKLNLSVSLNTARARDCYASTLKWKGVSVSIISESLNHSDISTTTTHYLDEFEQETLDKSNDVVL